MPKKQRRSARGPCAILLAITLLCSPSQNRPNAATHLSVEAVPGSLSCLRPPDDQCGVQYAAESNRQYFFIFAGLWEDSNGSVLLFSADGAAEWAESDVILSGSYAVEASEAGVVVTLSFQQLCNPSSCAPFLATRWLRIVEYTRHRLEIFDEYFKGTFVLYRLP